VFFVLAAEVAVSFLIPLIPVGLLTVFQTLLPGVGGAVGNSGRVFDGASPGDPRK
jgi:hypothetical protein